MMTPAAFSIARLPRIVFGCGCFGNLMEIVSTYAQNILIVVGANSFKSGPHWNELQQQLKHHRMRWDMINVDGEPSPQFIDTVTSTYKSKGFQAIVGIGGGSVLDAAKAISGLVTTGESVLNYLEGVGPQHPYSDTSIPFIAVPTTAGTGSEATKNAVISIQGENGFKKSFRHDSLVAEYAIVDPLLLRSCPARQIAANGMDALTQLIESYVSTNSNRMTDALALSGLKSINHGLLPWYENANIDDSALSHMAYASLMSGITLAQTGLGSVHGLASPLGAFFPIPHGCVCGTLLASATDINIQKLSELDPNHPTLKKYAEISAILTQQNFTSEPEACNALVQLLDKWTSYLNLPLLSEYGVRLDDVDKIVLNSRGSSMKTNPIDLNDEEIAQILYTRI